MSVSVSSYHRQVASEKRAAILDAAMTLFTSSGYTNTSLAQIAASGGVSKATLFKQFPTKHQLFEAIVTDYWETGKADERAPACGDPKAGLTLIGRRYADLLCGDRMAGLTRMVIAEAPRFPELARIQFDLGKAPLFDQVCQYLKMETTAGQLAVADPVMAAVQFLGMISNYVLWPRMLLVDWKLSTADVERVVAEAVTTMLARHTVPAGPGRG